MTTLLHDVNYLQTLGLKAGSQATGARRLAIGYVRSATESQAGSRLDTQTAQITAMAETEGFELIRIVRDAGQSAHNLNRPGLINLLSVVESGRVDAVIIRDLSRLARNAQYLLRLLRLFKTRGVALISAVEPINIMSGTGRRY